tara:strand:- start:11 stop:163 length:153 start_codon:yes stop_codon:yes gene_type:complete
MPGLYANMNARKKKKMSRSKKRSTISPKVYGQMSSKKGGFAPKPKPIKRG